jgi:hypothetical protein
MRPPFQHNKFADDKNLKPPYSYAALICLAMASTREKMALNQIYAWIKEQFAFYRTGDQCWQVCTKLPILGNTMHSVVTHKTCSTLYES